MALHRLIQIAIASYLIAIGKSNSIPRTSEGRLDRENMFLTFNNNNFMEETKVISNQRHMETVNVCVNGLECYHGGTCVDTKFRSQRTGMNHFVCDCKTIPGIKSYAGIQCEHEASDYCAFGSVSAKSSFCANGGECKMKNGPNQDGSVTHAGCHCREGFTGSFCEYKIGYTPQDIFKKELVENKPEESSQNQKTSLKKGKTGKSTDEKLIIVFSVIICVLVLGLGTIITVWTRRRKQKQTKNIESASDEFTTDKIKNVEIT